jgi:hypothetical protein
MGFPRVKTRFEEPASWGSRDIPDGCGRGRRRVAPLSPKLGVVGLHPQRRCLGPAGSAGQQAGSVRHLRSRGASIKAAAGAVGGERLRDRDAERLGGLEVDDELYSRDLLHGRSAGFSPFGAGAKRKSPGVNRGFNRWVNALDRVMISRAIPEGVFLGATDSRLSRQKESSLGHLGSYTSAIHDAPPYPVRPK